jgi:hypothetical protein
VKVPWPARGDHEPLDPFVVSLLHDAVTSTRETREGASEIKFVVDAATAAGIRDRAREVLSPDPYASGPLADEYATTTLYFDTADHAVYNRRGSYRRAKYRVRRYGSGTLVFLERKLRTSEMVSKRRSAVRIEDLPLLTATAVDRNWIGAWFHERLLMRRLGSVVQVAYDRTARVGMTDAGPIRLTLDTHLRAIPVDVPDFQPMDEPAPLQTQTIVELKFRGAMPAVFKRIVEEFALLPERVSKYRLGIEAARPSVAADAVLRKAAAAAAKVPNA